MFSITDKLQFTILSSVSILVDLALDPHCPKWSVQKSEPWCGYSYFNYIKIWLLEKYNEVVFHFFPIKVPWSYNCPSIVIQLQTHPLSFICGSELTLLNCVDGATSNTKISVNLACNHDMFIMGDPNAN